VVVPEAPVVPEVVPDPVSDVPLETPVTP